MGKSKELFMEMENELLSLSSSLENGEISHIDFFIEAKLRQQQFEGAAKQWKEAISEHIDLIAYQAKELPDGKKGYKFEVRNGSKSFDYSKCPTHKLLKQQIKDEESKLKLAYNSSIKGILQADENGEDIILPIAKYGKPTVILKVKKNDF